MTQIRSILSNSLLLKELSGDEVEIILSLLSVRHVSRGEVITHPKDECPDDLFILVNGCIEVRIESEEGLNSIIVVKLGDLAGIITFSGKSNSSIKVTIVALEATQVLNMERASFESLIYTDPRLMYRFYQGIVRHTHRMMRHFNSALIDLRKQISPSGGGELNKGIITIETYLLDDYASPAFIEKRQNMHIMLIDFRSLRRKQ